MAIDTLNKQLAIMESDTPWEPGIQSVSAAFTTQQQFALIWSYVESVITASKTRGIGRAIHRGIGRSM